MIDKIKIGWKEYEIKFAEPTEILVEADEERCGEIDYYNQLININKNIPEELRNETLIHEILHGIGEMYFIDLGEETVGKLSAAMYTVLKDNKLKIAKE